MLSEATPVTISSLISTAARIFPESLALLAPGRPSLTYRRLSDLANEVVRHLNRMGIAREDRVAVVLENGPELASAFLTLSSAATCAPLNPDYREAEFDFYLQDLNARTVVVRQGIDSPVRAAAHNRGVALLELVAKPAGEAGMFTLTDPAGSAPVVRGPARENDIALVLHTSGTTARPKRVPLTHANVCISAHNIAATLRLTPEDRCLNVMPLFHIHGLIGATLASVAAAASLVCTLGYDAERFFAWLQEFRPTWYTGVPTIHQSILAQSARHREAWAHTGLRLIRSSSAALPPQVLEELERTFQVPVLESYGMTEASHQMCSNPLPPGQRKPGSVGLPAGPEVAVLDPDGRLLGPNATGELVIRGANVNCGYENNPEANATAFTNGWFRTGDQGYRDEEGYFFLTARLKELINRGGEKIAPREVDEALLSHPAVAQAVTFSVPHVRLGEDVAAAVVLRSGTSATEGDLRQHALERLAAHKVPSRVLFVDQVPKGPTGKLQRIGLHEKLGDLLHTGYVAPEGPVEETVAAVWREVLGLERVGARDNFFSLGGDSLLATRAVASFRAAFDVEVRIDTFFHSPTVAEQALVLEELVLRMVESLTERE
jgi:acyl-CoA synthetase (AMP-forming)/AMP-acid ligase II